MRGLRGREGVRGRLAPPGGREGVRGLRGCEGVRGLGGVRGPPSHPPPPRTLAPPARYPLRPLAPPGRGASRTPLAPPSHPRGARVAPLTLGCMPLTRVRGMSNPALRVHTPGKMGPKSLSRRPPAVHAPHTVPAATPCSSSVLSECRCYPRLPAGGYLTTTSRVQGADASTASTRVQRTADHRRAHQVVDETPSTGPPCPPRVRAAPPARSQGVCAPSGEAPRVHHTHSTTGAHVRACCIVLVA